MTTTNTETAMWTDSLVWSLTWARGQMACGDCELYAKRGETCSTCGGKGKHPGIETAATLGERAEDYALDAVREAIHQVAQLVADATVAREAAAAGVPRLDLVPEPVAALFDELAARGPELARVAGLLVRIAEVLEPYEIDDPRTARRAALAAETTTHAE